MPTFYGSEEERLWINMQLDSRKIDMRVALRYLSQWCRAKTDRMVAAIEKTVAREAARKKLASIRARM